MTRRQRTIQIMPADGWYAVRVLVENAGATSAHAYPLIGWALVERWEGYDDDRPAAPYTCVMGLHLLDEAIVVECDPDDDHFLGYLAPGQELDDSWHEEARLRMDAAMAERAKKRTANSTK